MHSQNRCIKYVLRSNDLYFFFMIIWRVFLVEIFYHQMVAQDAFIYQIWRWQNNSAVSFSHLRFCSARGHWTSLLGSLRKQKFLELRLMFEKLDLTIGQKSNRTLRAYTNLLLSQINNILSQWLVAVSFEPL